MFSFSQQLSAPRVEPIGLVMSGADSYRSEPATPCEIPPGLEIPESWRHPKDDLRCSTTGWAPRFKDDPDVESRLGKDIEDFSPEEWENFKQMEGLGIQIPPDLEGM